MSVLKVFLLRIEEMRWENSFSDVWSKKQCLWIKESFVNSKKISLIQRNRFVYIKENLFESTKLFSIQRNFFFDRISKKCFHDSKKLFSGCEVKKPFFKFKSLCLFELKKFKSLWTKKKIYSNQANFCLPFWIEARNTPEAIDLYR